MTTRDNFIFKRVIYPRDIKTPFGVFFFILVSQGRIKT